MSIEVIRSRLAQFEPVHLEIIDDSSLHTGHSGNLGGGHYTVIIESSHFEGKSTIMRHRLIYQALGDLIPEKIHALSIHAGVPGATQSL